MEKYSDLRVKLLERTMYFNYYFNYHNHFNISSTKLHNSEYWSVQMLRKHAASPVSVCGLQFAVGKSCQLSEWMLKWTMYFWTWLFCAISE
jgi:hypothetical protein